MKLIKHSGSKWRERLNDLIKQRGIGRKPLSRQAGLSEKVVEQVLTVTANPGVETLAAIAKALGVSIGYLYDGECALAQRVNIIGAVTAGDGWTIYDDGLDEIEMSVPGGAPVGLEVVGDSMAPVYRDGDILIGGKKTSHFTDLLRHDCIIQTTSGQRVVKYLSRGRIRGRFTLRSYNPAHEDIEDAELEWAAPIAWVCRGGR